MNAFVLAEEELFLAREVTEDAVPFDFIGGEGVEAGGVGGGEFGVNCFGHAGDLDADHVRLGGGHALQTPEGGCHLGTGIEKQLAAKIGCADALRILTGCDIAEKRDARPFEAFARTIVPISENRPRQVKPCPDTRG